MLASWAAARTVAAHVCPSLDSHESSPDCSEGWVQPWLRRFGRTKVRPESLSYSTAENRGRRAKIRDMVGNRGHSWADSKGSRHWLWIQPRYQELMFTGWGSIKQIKA